MGKKYLDTKQNTIEAAVLDVWVDAAEEQKAIRSAARMVVDDTMGEQMAGWKPSSEQEAEYKKRKKREDKEEKKKEKQAKKTEIDLDKAKTQSAAGAAAGRPVPTDAEAGEKIRQNIKTGASAYVPPPVVAGSSVGAKASPKPAAMPVKVAKKLDDPTTKIPQVPRDDTIGEPVPDPKDKPVAAAPKKEKELAKMDPMRYRGPGPGELGQQKAIKKVEPPKKVEKKKDERDAFTRWAEKKLGLNRSAAQIKKDMKAGKRDPAYGDVAFGSDSQAHYNSYQHELEVQEAIRDAVNRINEVEIDEVASRQDMIKQQAARREKIDKGMDRARGTRKDIDTEKQRDADIAQDAPGASGGRVRRPAGSQTGSGTSSLGST